MSSTLKKKRKNYVMQDIFANVKDQLLSFSFGKHLIPIVKSVLITLLFLLGWFMFTST